MNPFPDAGSALAGATRDTGSGSHTETMRHLRLAGSARFDLGHGTRQLTATSP